MRLGVLLTLGVAGASACAHPTTELSSTSVPFPEATVGETPKLVFHVAAPASAGTLEAQTRRALEDLLSRDHNTRILRLRVFAVGQTRLDTLHRLVEVVLSTRHVALLFSRAARVSAPRLLFTGTLQALGDSASDMRALMERATRVIEGFGGNLRAVAMADNFWLTAAARDALRPVRSEAYGATVPAATGVFTTSLASLRGTVALELVIPLLAPRDP